MKTKLLTLLALHLGLAAVHAQPVITNQPQNQTNFVGTTAMFTVGATGAQPLSYQWRSHATANSYTNIPFGKEATLVLTNVQPTSRRFAVVVTDAGGLSATSSPLVTLTVIVPPAITTQPTSQAGEVSGTSSFSMVATGTPPLVFQWRLNDLALAGKTNNTLVLTNLQFTNAGSYSTVVTNAAGAATSQVARLTVLPPIFTKITNGAIVNDGGHSSECAWGDYNNDSFEDLFVANDSGEDDFLYRNNGNGTFTRITNGILVNDGRNSIGCIWADYDNDGYLDLFVANNSDAELPETNSLFRNNGDGTFTSITSGILVTDRVTALSAAWGDFDNDGFVDLFVPDEGQGNGRPGSGKSFLYRNQGDGTFDRITNSTVTTSDNLDSIGCAWGDYDNDGRLDLFVSRADDQNDLLYRNGGGGMFTKITSGSVVNDRLLSVGCAWGDYDNDGWLDLFVSNGGATGPEESNRLYHNDGRGGFDLITSSSIGTDIGFGAGCAWGDFDNDGFLDLYVCRNNQQHNVLYHNEGNGTFSRLTQGSLGNVGGQSVGCAWADYDNDGFLDLFVANGAFGAAQNNFLYRNNGNSNAWFKIKLVGTQSNRAAIGAKVRVRAVIGGTNRWQMREISGGGIGQNSLIAHFGLGDSTNVDLVRIEWPSGAVQELHNVASKQFLTITEPPRLLVSKTNGAPQFAINGGRGFNYQIDTSTNLIDWSFLGTVVVTNQSGTEPLTNINVIDTQERFYRALAR